jgi:ribosomal protein S18 acetylase RimI-like enzyme
MEDLYLQDLAQWSSDNLHGRLSSPPATVREMRATDVSGLHAVYADAFSTRPAPLLSREDWIPKWPLHPLCVARMSGVAVGTEALAGYLLAYVDPLVPEEGYIGQIGVLRAQRRNGIATGLILRTLEAFVGARLKRAALRVSQENRSAIELYKKLGFVRHG